MKRLQVAPIECKCSSARSSAEDLDRILPSSHILRLRELRDLLPLRQPTEDELRGQDPILAQAPLANDLIIDESIVMLQIGTQTLSLEGEPEQVLVHGIGVLAPLGVLVGIRRGMGYFGGDIRSRLSVFEEHDLFRFSQRQRSQTVGGRRGTNSAMSATERINAAFGHLGLLLALDVLRDFGPHDVPEFLVVGAEEDDLAGGLGVECRGDVAGSVVDDVQQLAVRDWGGFGELVDGAAGGGRVEDGGC